MKRPLFEEFGSAGTRLVHSNRLFFGNLLLGVSRVAFAMGREGDLPHSLSKLGAGENPWRSVIFVGVITILVAGFADFGIAVAVSSFGTLLYYSVTNISALRLKLEQRAFPRWLAVAGIVGCLGLAISLAPREIAIGLAILVGGVIFRLVWLRIKREPKDDYG